MSLDKDTVLAKIYPGLGFELARIIITNDSIYYNNFFLNQSNSIKNPYFKLNFRNLNKYIIQARDKRDTISYKNTNQSILFTDYVSLSVNNKKQNSFWPKTIILNSNEAGPWEGQHIIKIEYKSIKLYKQ